MSDYVITPGNRHSINQDLFAKLESLNNDVKRSVHQSTSTSTLQAFEGPTLSANLQEADSSVPQLVLPKGFSSTEQPQITSLTSLVGQLMRLLSESNSGKLYSRLKQISALSQSKSAEVKRLLESYNKAYAESQQATQNAGNDKIEHEQALIVVKQTEEALELATEKLSGLSSDDKGYPAALLQQKKAEKNHNAAIKQSVVTERKVTSSANLALEKIHITDQHYSKLQGAAKIEPDVLNTCAEQNLSGMAAMTLLLGQLSNLISKNAEDNLKTNAELAQKMQEARQLELQAKAKEQAEAIRKAQELSEKMGCAGKILGGILTVVSIAAAGLTGGASLALAAVGIALMIADPIVEAVTGTSITSRVMAPILEHVIQPMMKFIADNVKAVLKDLNIDEDLANTLSNIAAVIVTVVIVIAATLVAKSAGKALIKKLMPMMQKLMTRVMTKIVPTALKNASKSITQSISKVITKMANSLGLSKGSPSLARLTSIADNAAIGMGVIKTTVDCTNTITTGMATKKIAGLEGDIIEAMADVKLISKQLKFAVEVFSNQLKSSLDAVEQITMLNLNRNNTNLSILNPHQI